jgi:hypothetical protein
MDQAIPNVPEYRADEDAWYGPTACVWQAGYTAALVAGHVLFGCSLPDPIAEQWMWFREGHWPCGYAEDPPPNLYPQLDEYEEVGLWNENQMDVPVSKLLVY